MSFTNIEIKARTTQAKEIRQYLLAQNAEFRGTDVQTDTYFNVPSGRLKLREGNIENSLIYYKRENTSGLKQSDFELFPVNDGITLKHILTKAVGVKIIVKKSREIYYIRNVKFHLDVLQGTGEFVEIEATNMNFDFSVDELREQCSFYMREFGVADDHLVPVSYSDMLMAGK
jgi:predicted adenylyl cyclase CyaB